MTGNHVLMRLNHQSALLVVLAILAGCSYNDGIFVYHVDGRVMDADRSPLPQRPIVASLQPFTVNAEVERASFRTDDEGHFSLEFGTGLAWGYMELFGLIPLGSTKGPVPPCLENLYIAVQGPSGIWQCTELELTKERQRKAAPTERWISAGDIRMPDD